MNTTTFIEKIAIGLLIGGAAFIVIAVLLYSNNQVVDFSKSIDANLYSSFGSFLSGTVGCMWSLASVLLFYRTLIMQKEQIVSDQKEMNSRIKQIQDQNDQFAQERIENTFFNLLNYHHVIIDNIEFKNPSDPKVSINGKECFKKLYYIFTANMDAQEKGNGKKKSIEIFGELLDKYQESIGSYFRNLYNIFKYIDNSCLKNKKEYTNLIRAQLSTYELLLLYYNCATTHGQKFSKYAVKYELFDNVNISKLIDKSHSLFYPKNAFGERVIN